MNGDNPQEAQAEVVSLKQRGFQEGAQEHLSTSQDEALSDALVFSSAQGAKQEFSANLSEDMTSHHAGLKRFTVAAIPRAVGFGQQQAHAQGATADVLFTTGRCFLLIGDALNGRTARKQANSAAIAGATALYRRLRHSCA